MKADIFKLPGCENRPKALAASCFISLLLHGLILGGLGLALPLKVVSPPRDPAIIIDLAAMDPQMAARPKSLGETQKAVAPEPQPEPTQAAPIRQKSRPQKNMKPEPPKAANKNAAGQKAQAATKIGGTGGKMPDALSAARQVKAAPGWESGTPSPGISAPVPVYPELARKRGQEGTVNVRCQVDAHGQVVNVAIAQSSGFRLLDEAALKAVAKWKFKPGRKNGENVAGTVVVPIQFKLQ